MRPIATLVLACLVSLIGYFGLFGFVLERPLSIDIIRPMLDHKLAHAAHQHGEKIWILAGSNARMSHSCAVLEQNLHRPCINLRIAGSVRLDWVTAQSERFMQPGDLVYMPLEYSSYVCPRAVYFTSQDAAYSFRHQREALWSRGAEGFIRAAFLFDLPALVTSLGEMGLNAMHVRRRYGVETLDAQGDETGNSDANAEPYAAKIAAAQFQPPQLWAFDAHRDGCQAFAARFLDWARQHGVRVVGGLPTTFADVRIDPALVAHIEDFYRAHGAAFVVLPDRSSFPRSAFYDEPYHLRQRGQIAHSRELATALRDFTRPPRGISHP